MAIESSGAISLGSAAGTNRSIAGEFGGSTPHSLSEYYRDGSYSDGIVFRQVKQAYLHQVQYPFQIFTARQLQPLNGDQ